MWPFIRPEITKTFVEPSILEYIITKQHIQKNFFHEIAYTSHTLPKRIELGNAGDANPYHFFFYMLSRFYYFDNGSDDIIFYYTEGNNNYLAESALALLPSHFKRETKKTEGFEYIEMPGCAWFADSLQEEWMCAYVRDLFRSIWESTPQEKGKYTYISRNKNQIQGRRVLNEDELILPLKEIGFSTYVMECLTFEQQIKLFRSSEVITGLHGAGFAWLIFCFPGTVFLEIQNPFFQVPKGHYEDISRQCKLQYIKFQDIEKPNENEYSNIHVDDCIVKKDAYISTLKTIIESI